MSTPKSFEENTLGIILGGHKKGRRSRTFGRERTPRTLRSADVDTESLGTGYLGTGLMVASMILVSYGLVQYLLNWATRTQSEREQQVWGVTAWGVVTLLMVVIHLTHRRHGRGVPNGMFAVILGLVVIAVAIDLAGVLAQAGTGTTPSAAVACGAVLVAVVTLRPSVDILIATAVLGTAVFATLIVSRPDDPFIVGKHIAIISLTVLPPLLAVFLVSAFRRMVQMELDRALVHSSVSAPKFAIGMLASHELARLDLNAERLLDEVASGEIELPLAPNFASTAASLATELRLHLIEGRRETWLYHVITESEYLGPLVALSDPHFLSAQLNPDQRDGLLSAIWLLMSDTKKSGESLKLTLGPARANVAQPPTKSMILIEILVTGVPRRRIDPATWEGIRRVGKYREITNKENIRIEIDCLVENLND